LFAWRIRQDGPVPADGVLRQRHAPLTVSAPAPGIDWPTALGGQQLGEHPDPGGDREREQPIAGGAGQLPNRQGDPFCTAAASGR
jgi:hypothetical protein